MDCKQSTILGVECGATSSTAVVLLSDNSTKTFKLGSANFKLLTAESLQQFFETLCNVLVENGVNNVISKIGVGMPGILTDADKQILTKCLFSIWPNVKHIWVGSDLETALACVDGNARVKLIIICGTGACCFGTNGLITAKVGGYGHVIGDRGSGYSIAHEGLRAALKEYEFNGQSDLLNSLMKVLKLETVHDLVSKVTSPAFSKTDMAALVPIIFDAWQSGDSCATLVVKTAVESLVEDAVCLVAKLTSKLSSKIKIGFTGSLLTESLPFQSLFTHKLSESLEKILTSDTVVEIQVLKDTSRGALKMVEGPSNASPETKSVEECEIKNSSFKTRDHLSENELKEMILPLATSLSPTESRNSKSKHLDKMSVPDAIDLWLEEENSFYSRIAEHRSSLERIIRRVTKTFRNEGRLFYVGAGTSGRLGILDASECPPTFKSPPHWVQGIIAGGQRAIQFPVEGAEDSLKDGMQAIQDHEINSKDIVIGIASSGRTPYVWGSLYKAKELGAFTCLLAFNPNMTLKYVPDEVININVGPEILTGSTRLKCGSATKCILNMITTLSMVQYGKCLENLMVDLMPVNQKLRERSLRIVLILVNSRDDGVKRQREIVSEELAKQVLVRNEYSIKKTVHELLSI